MFGIAEIATTILKVAAVVVAVWIKGKTGNGRQVVLDGPRCGRKNVAVRTFLGSCDGQVLAKVIGGWLTNVLEQFGLYWAVGVLIDTCLTNLGMILLTSILLLVLAGTTGVS